MLLSSGFTAAQWYRALIDPLVPRLRSRIVRLCSELDAHEVLDIACASGAQCRLLGARGIQAVGLDISESMIEGARQMAGPNTEYVCASAYNLPFSSGAFDVSILSLALHEHTEQERTDMLHEALRVTRSGGMLIVADYSRPPRPWLNIPWWMILAIENLAGGSHRSGFHDFVARGSLDGLLDRRRLKPSFHIPSHLGAITIAAVPVPAENRRRHRA